MSQYRVITVNGVQIYFNQNDVLEEYDEEGKKHLQLKRAYTVITQVVPAQSQTGVIMPTAVNVVFPIENVEIIDSARVDIIADVPENSSIVMSIKEIETGLAIASNKIH